MEKERRFEISLAARRASNKLADFCNSLPLAGKAVITPLTLAAFRERNPYYKTVRSLEVEVALGLLALGHALQAKMGLENLQKNLEAVSENPSADKILACCIDVAYSLANCAAVYSQLHLSNRLAGHLRRMSAQQSQRLESWGIVDDRVDHELVAKKLFTAILDNDQASIDTFFMILPREEKLRVMEDVRVFSQIVEETDSSEDFDKILARLEKNVDKNSRLRYLLVITINAHKRGGLKTPYSFKEQMKMFILTMACQIGFVNLG
jgi:hypothetical protein